MKRTQSQIVQEQDPSKTRKVVLVDFQNDKLNKDIFQKHIADHQKSKTVKGINLIYSIVIGIVTMFLSKKYFKYGKTLGVIMALTTYVACRKMITQNQDHQNQIKK